MEVGVAVGCCVGLDVGGGGVGEIVGAGDGVTDGDCVAVFCRAAAVILGGLWVAAEEHAARAIARMISVGSFKMLPLLVVANINDFPLTKRENWAAFELRTNKTKL